MGNQTDLLTREKLELPIGNGHRGLNLCGRHGGLSGDPGGGRHGKRSWLPTRNGAGGGAGCKPPRACMPLCSLLPARGPLHGGWSQGRGAVWGWSPGRDIRLGAKLGRAAVWGGVGRGPAAFASSQPYQGPRTWGAEACASSLPHRAPQQPDVLSSLSSAAESSTSC